jgi:hypothetical protein
MNQEPFIEFNKIELGHKGPATAPGRQCPLGSVQCTVLSAAWFLASEHSNKQLLPQPQLQQISLIPNTQHCPAKLPTPNAHGRQSG